MTSKTFVPHSQFGRFNVYDIICNGNNFDFRQGSAGFHKARIGFTVFTYRVDSYLSIIIT